MSTQLLTWRFFRALILSVAIHALALVLLPGLLPVRTLPPRPTAGDPLETPADEPTISISGPRQTDNPDGQLREGPPSIEQVSNPPRRFPLLPQAPSPAPVPRTLPHLEAEPLEGMISPGGIVPSSLKSVGAATSPFFPVEPIPRRLLYVIDCSMSMGKNGALEAAFLELLKSLKNLPAGSRFQIVVYNSSASLLFPHRDAWLPATPEIIQDVARAVLQVRAEGLTDHGPALKLALGLQPEVVYFLTDADDLRQEHLRIAYEWNRNRAVIHTVELTALHRDRPAMPLQVLARTSGGMYRAVDLSVYWSATR